MKLGGSLGNVPQKLKKLVLKMNCWDDGDGARWNMLK
jgi:hypothetical protein